MNRFEIVVPQIGNVELVDKEFNIIIQMNTSPDFKKLICKLLNEHFNNNPKDIEFEEIIEKNISKRKNKKV